MSESIPKKILIVEDEPTQRILAKEFLELAGYSVRSSEDGQHGLNMAIKTLPDLIMVDLLLPSIDGYELCKRLKNCEETAHIPVILFTGSKDPDVVKKGLEVGADDFIIKPIDWQFLEDRVSFVLNRFEQNDDENDGQTDAGEDASREEDLQTIQDLTDTATAASSRICELESQLEDVRRAADAQVAAQSELEGARAEADRQIQTLKDELSDAQAASSQEIEALKSQHKDNVDQLTAEFNAQLDAAQKRFEEERVAITERYESELSVLREHQSEQPLAENAADDLSADDQGLAAWSIVTQQCSHYEDVLDTIASLTAQPADSESERTRLAKITKEVDRITHATGRLKKLAQVAVEKDIDAVEFLDLNEFLHDFESRIVRIADKRSLQVDVQLLEEPCSVSIEPNRLRFAYSLLVTNALRSTPKGGTITLGAVRDADGTPKLFVSDNGVGMAPAQVEWCRTCMDKAPSNPNATPQGAGLEFPLVTVLARQQDVALEMDSQQGEGMSVSLVFSTSSVAQNEDNNDDVELEVEFAC